MKRPVILSALALVLSLGAAPAAAQCYADYKAKRDNPLQLHYGVIELPQAACGSTSAAAQEIGRRLSGTGWELLNVMAVFDQDGLAERQANAGQYFLRF